MTAEEIYQQKCNDNSDICQHMPTLRRYSEGLHCVVELGTRSIVSTWAFLVAKPKVLISVDIKYPEEYKDYDPGGCDLDLVFRQAERLGVCFDFFHSDSIDVLLPVCDLMLFDTKHTYDQLSNELASHGNNVSRYMIFHDTETYKDELMPAISEYMGNNQQWVVKEKFTNNNGLLILERI